MSTEEVIGGGVGYFRVLSRRFDQGPWAMVELEGSPLKVVDPLGLALPGTDVQVRYETVKVKTEYVFVRPVEIMRTHEGDTCAICGEPIGSEHDCRRGPEFLKAVESLTLSDVCSGPGEDVCAGCPDADSCDKVTEADADAATKP